MSITKYVWCATHVAHAFLVCHRFGSRSLSAAWACCADGAGDTKVLRSLPQLALVGLRQPGHSDLLAYNLGQGRMTMASFLPRSLEVDT